MKIMVVMGEYPPEEAERRRQAVLKCASPGTEIGFAVIRATFFRRSNSQVNSLSAGPLVAEVAVKAEADGLRRGRAVWNPRRRRRASAKFGSPSDNRRRTIGIASRRSAE